ncbi:hypothetical protein ONZ45_g3744 [Pleurotus djamor]|nr:hypothetical protein ONZ45_g3744 [Pleurotus djamor]
MSDVPSVLGFGVFRFVIIGVCRKYLLQSSLYSDLQRLSSAPDGLHSSTSEDADWVALPTVAPQAPSSSVATPTKPLVVVVPFHSDISTVTFAACFAETLVLVSLLLLQTLDTLSARARYINWLISLFLLTATIVLLVPLFISIILSLGSASGVKSKRRSFKFRLLVNAIPVAVYLAGFSYIPLPDAVSSTDVSTATLSRLIVLGTIVLGLLSGFGALNNAWEFLPFFSRSRSVPTEGDIKTSENSLTRIRQDTQQLRLQLQGPSVQSGTEERQGTWYSRFLPKLGGDERLQELKGLEALERQMSLDLDALRNRRQAAQFSATLKGRLYNLGGSLFSVYCIIRVISSLYNLISPMRSQQQTSYPDLISKGVAYTLSLISNNVDLAHVARISRQISLAFVGAIILSSIRLVLRGVTRVLRVTNRSLGASLMLLFLAQIMGIYMLSTIVQLRLTFPPPPDGSSGTIANGKLSIPNNLFATIPEYEVFGSLFDGSFLLAAVGTFVVRWGASRMFDMD